MRPKNGLKQWLKQVENKNEHGVTETERTGCRFGEGIGTLHQFLRREITRDEYVSRILAVSGEERQAAYHERIRLGVLLNGVDSMGLYNGYSYAYEESVEYLSRNQESERQTGIQGTLDAAVIRDHTVDTTGTLTIEQYQLTIQRLLESEYGPSSTSSRSG